MACLHTELKPCILAALFNSATRFTDRDRYLGDIITFSVDFSVV